MPPALFSRRPCWVKKGHHPYSADDKSLSCVRVRARVRVRVRVHVRSFGLGRRRMRTSMRSISRRRPRYAPAPHHLD